MEEYKRIQNKDKKCYKNVYSYMAACQTCFIQCMTIHFYTFLYRIGKENTFSVSVSATGLGPFCILEIT